MTSRDDTSYMQAMLVDVTVGVVAGLVAAAAMHAFQAAVAGQFKELAEGKPATARAADAVYSAAAGKPLPKKAEPAASTGVHYLTGAVLGGTYGLLAGMAPIVTVGRGLGFGAVTWLLGDELAVPALGLGAKASETPPERHAYGAASHAVFALVLDFVRRKVNETIAVP